VEVLLDHAAFAAVREAPVDIAVMEKTARAAVAPCSIGWADIGSWSEVWRLSGGEDDPQANVTTGPVTVLDGVGNLVRSDGVHVSIAGVDNLVVIATENGILILPRDRSQDVKHIYAQLKASGHEAHKLHRTVHRPWGTYTVIEEGPGFKIKRIEVKPGEALSLQMHHHRSEHWVVVSGVAMVVNGAREIMVHTNESTFIPAGQQHRLTNPGKTPCVMIEVQSGGYLGEDDIVRFDDQYGRVPVQGAQS
jgi:mannose-1-phosphate guanylyltransferase